MQPRILIIYTGGTIGMISDKETGSLKPFHLEGVIQSIPSILQLGIDLYALELDQVIDSSNITPAVWVELAEIIEENYASYDGFLVLHGSDTMAYSASALSFMLENLGKPVIFTGSQLPIGLPRTDARENLITALMIAALRNGHGQPMIPEVCIYFEDKLYRGNRTHKFNSENFDAFLSVNYPLLAEAGVHIKVHEELLLPHPKQPLKVHTGLSRSLSTIKLFPGISIDKLVDMHLAIRTEAIILETYGSGNGPNSPEFIAAIKRLTDNNVIVLNVTQCREGMVEMDKYETGKALLDAGVISGADMTAEAAITKTMHVLGECNDILQRKKLLSTSLRGEMTA
jgi:L-asparaginase